MTKKAVFLTIAVLGVLLALAGTPAVRSKAHVPLGRAQICTQNDVVKNVAARALERKLGQGACRLTACTFDYTDNDGNLVTQYVFFPGDSCDSTDVNQDGFCDATGAPSDIPKHLKAINVTPACTDPF